MELLALSLALLVGAAPAQAAAAPSSATPSSAAPAAAKPTAAKPPAGPGPAVVAPVPPPASSGRGFRLERPAPLTFSVVTNAGPVEGTLQVTEIIARGLDGRGRFDLVVKVDPSSLRTGDRLRDRVVESQLLGGEAVGAGARALVFTSTARVVPQKPPLPEAGGEAADEPATELPAAAGTLEGPRGSRPLELRYSWRAEAEQGTLEVVHEATVEELGLGPLDHPFVQLTGPLRLTLTAPLVRER